MTLLSLALEMERELDLANENPFPPIFLPLLLTLVFCESATGWELLRFRDDGVSGEGWVGSEMREGWDGTRFTGDDDGGGIGETAPVLKNRKPCLGAVEGIDLAMVDAELVVVVAVASAILSGWFSKN